MRTPAKVVLGLIVCGILVRLASFNSHSDTNQKSDFQKQQQAGQPTEELTPPTPAEQRKYDAQRKKDLAELDKENEPVRVQFAKFTEDSLLREGFDVDVTAYGPKHKFLKFRYVLASKSFVFNFNEQRQDMIATMKQEGFTKFSITDGYDANWTWDLTK